MSGQRADAVANRQRLLSAARRVFAEQGPSAEIKDIAAAAGLAPGTMYRNFESKDELVLTLLREAAAANAKAYTEIDELGIVDAIQRIFIVLTRSFEAARQYGWLLEALWTGQLPARWREEFSPDENVERLRGLIREGVGQGYFPSDLDVDLAIGMLTGPLVLASFLGLSARPAESAATAVIDLFMAGGQRSHAAGPRQPQ